MFERSVKEEERVCSVGSGLCRNNDIIGYAFACE